MAENSQDTSLQDDQVLKALFRQGAKETPPAQLNSKILDYAAKAHHAAPETSHVGSHFGGGWKVPLSLAASVVVVFALLVQLDQTHDTMELPPIPEIALPKDSTKNDALKSKPILEETNETAGSMRDDSVLSTHETLEYEADTTEDSNAVNEGVIEDLIIQEAPSPVLQQPNAAKKQEQQTKPAQVYEAPVKLNKPKAASTPQTKPFDGYAPEIKSSERLEKQAQEPAGAAADRMDQRSMQPSAPYMSRKESMGASSTATESDAALEANDESIFAPLPVEDWLLMIEKLVAQKDYAEAARQLQKFKQAHPKVNVEDLEAKIP